VYLTAVNKSFEILREDFMKKIIIGIVTLLFASSIFAESEYIIKNKARRFCREDPEKCTPAYLMEKYPGSKISRGDNGNCVNVEIANVKTIGGERDVEQSVFMGDLTVICDD